MLVTGLQKKLSDLVGTSNLKISENLNIKYNFSLDQNYNDLNYNEVVSTLNFEKLSLDFNTYKRKNILEIMSISKPIWVTKQMQIKNFLSKIKEI